MKLDTAMLERHPWVCVVVIASVTCVVYSSSLDGVFHFDDASEIIEDTRIHSLSFPSIVDQLKTRRPVVTVSLAVNHALGGVDPTGYHVGNIVVHVLAALTLFGLIRRTVAGFPSHCPVASRLAFAAAGLWVLHPLQTESVTYVILQCVDQLRVKRSSSI